MTRFSTPRFSAIAIAVVAGLALPAVASAAPKSANADTSTSQQTDAAKTQRYCVVDDSMTGSRLAKRECKTLDAWLAEGFDPRTKK